jgi:hypothetical protein
MFHITPKRNIASILLKGLLINSENLGITVYRNSATRDLVKQYGCIPLFFTDNVDYIVKEMLTADWIKKNNPIVLELLFPEKYNLIDRDKHEFICLTNILPCDIRYNNVQEKEGEKKEETI